ncbi:MAG: response regulator [Actinobacteria bacterium]|nr:MAG: response regulator [Actinomycetota bacterium]
MAATAKPGSATSARANGSTAVDEQALGELRAAVRAARAGDFSARLNARRKGVLGEIAADFNELVATNHRMANELVRVGRIIGREGRMTVRASLPGASGEWQTALEAVNSLIDDLVRPTTEVARVIGAVAEGDLSQKMAMKIEGQPVKGEFLRIGTTVNTMVDQLSSFADEVTRVAREVGTEGKLGGQAEVEGVSGTWEDLTDSVNFMANNLTDQVRNIAQVATAVAQGDLSEQITVDAKGEILELKDTINTMVEQLRSFAAEVTRVAREVGTEGKLGGQAEVAGVSGTWRGLTENVNLMASNLTDQVRNIAQVTTAVANGDLSQKITVDAKGEILELKDTINTMVDQLSSFADEVTRVAREVGTEGKLGGQAEVEGVSGTWRGLTENVNQLAGNLTTQVRAIAEVSTAVTQGDLTRSIAVEAQGEVAELKDNINQMIANLRYTTQRNEEQDWLKTNLARISGLMQGQRELRTVSRLIMSELTPTVQGQLGAFFLAETPDGEDAETELRLIASYGYRTRGEIPTRWALGEGLVGQAAVEKKPILITGAPQESLRITSGLADVAPANIIVMPILFEEQLLGVIELASLEAYSDSHLTFLEQLMETLGVVLNTIIANMRTEELLQQSQSLTQELQNQSEELQQRQDELTRSNAELEQRNRDIETKNREIELARRGLEEKAAQLALSSKYKSEFLANMSHELRTPLNSLLILSKLLAENDERNLSDKQLEFARTIHRAGTDLLELISDILDLSKIEAGKMEILPDLVALDAVTDYVKRTFQPVAADQGLSLEVVAAPDLPESVLTDQQRLEQVLRNLLSNAFKFTEVGGVTLTIARASDERLLFSVSDTGPGIAEDKLQFIFEAFQQADGTTSRKYGGTGLGLSISRELARALGGELIVESIVGVGSSFTLVLPIAFPRSRPLGDGTGGPADGTIAPAERAQVIAAALSAEPARALDADANGGAGGGALAAETSPLRAATGAALGMLQRTAKRVLIVERGQSGARAVTGLIGRDKGVALATAASEEEAAGALGDEALDCLVLGAGVSKAAMFRLLDRLDESGLAAGPILLCPDRPLTDRDRARLRAYDTRLRTRVVANPEQIAAETAVALHRQPVRPATEWSSPRTAADDGSLGGRKVLLVDDDVRNLFALASLLEDAGMEVLFSETGQEALGVLERQQDVDLVLMDIMMPGMDGYQTMAAIREMPDFAKLPIIAVTAKAMQGDREKSLSAGASDYITKPVEPDKLMSLIRAWLRE